MRHNTNIPGQPLGFALPDWKPPAVPSREPMEGRFCRVEQFNPSLHAASLHAANALDVAGGMWTYLPYGPWISIAAVFVLFRWGWLWELTRITFSDWLSLTALAGIGGFGFVLLLGLVRLYRAIPVRAKDSR